MDKDEFWAELETLGIDQVRENIGLGLYREKREKLAIEWLRQQNNNKDSNRSRWYKNHPIIAGIIVTVAGGLILFGIVSLIKHWQIFPQ